MVRKSSKYARYKINKKTSMTMYIIVNSLHCKNMFDIREVTQ